MILTLSWKKMVKLKAKCTTPIKLISFLIVKIKMKNEIRFLILLYKSSKIWHLTYYIHNNIYNLNWRWNPRNLRESILFFFMNIFSSDSIIIYLIFSKIYDFYFSIQCKNTCNLNYILKINSYVICTVFFIINLKTWVLLQFY